MRPVQMSRKAIAYGKPKPIKTSPSEKCLVKRNIIFV